MESITGVVVGWGFQFDTTVGRPNKKKSVSHVSNEFGFEAMATTPIKMRELKRENGEFSSNPIGTKTYKEWKDAGHRLTKIVYIMDANAPFTIFKVQFAGLSFGAINKLLVDDLPNYLVTLKASSETTTTENGDFLMPTIVKVSDAPTECYDEVVKMVTFVYNILNSTHEAQGFESIPADSPAATGPTAEEVFGIDDIP